MAQLKRTFNSNTLKYNVQKHNNYLLFISIYIYIYIYIYI